MNFKLSKITPNDYYIQDNYWTYWELKKVNGAPEIGYCQTVEIITNALNSSIGINISKDNLTKIKNCLSENHPHYQELSTLLNGIIERM